MLKVFIAVCIVGAVSGQWSLPDDFNQAALDNYGKVFCTAEDRSCTNSEFCCMEVNTFRENWRDAFPLADVTEIFRRMLFGIKANVNLDDELAKAKITSLDQAYGICRPNLYRWERCGSEKGENACTCTSGDRCGNSLFLLSGTSKCVPAR